MVTKIKFASKKLAFFKEFFDTTTEHMIFNKTNKFQIYKETNKRMNKVTNLCYSIVRQGTSGILKVGFRNSDEFVHIRHVAWYVSANLQKRIIMCEKTCFYFSLKRLCFLSLVMHSWEIILKYMYSLRFLVS